jgi:hypothetical protein
VKLSEDYGAMYTLLHQNHKHYKGRSIRPYVEPIAVLVRQVEARRLLDYGSGKGLQYADDRVQERWGEVEVTCYDVGVPAFSPRPQGFFDGVICTDVMEHIAKADVPEVLADIIGYTETGRPAFVFFSICCAPARRKSLPDGRNVHLTVETPAWWNYQLQRFDRPELTIRAMFDERGE